MYGTTGAELRSQARLPGLGAAAGNIDLFQVRDGGHWLVATGGRDVHAARISPDAGTVFEERRGWRLPYEGRLYVTPLACGGLAVSSGGAVALHTADGGIAWTVPHGTWPGAATGGACAVDPRGGRLLAVTHDDTAGAPPQDTLLALDLTTGEVLSRTVLPTRYGSYAFQHMLPACDRVLLNAAQGQDEAYSLIAAPRGDEWRLTTVGTFDEPFTGSSAGPADFLAMAVGGESLTRHFSGVEPVTSTAAEVLPDDLVFAGLPGFLEGVHILTAAGEDAWAEETRHFVLDATTLRPVTELDYAGTGGPSPLPLGDGTWLTTEGDTVRRWSAVRARPRGAGNSQGAVIRGW
ncbi:hypothetical protein ACIBCM_12240 [Streptomyces sp. NPDC051018]|uniref:hypothetical protein n=1 Tax=Streptomyces sp. NPDC051018 TaxID=3365639 RepID=UPI0037895080